MSHSDSSTSEASAAKNQVTEVIHSKAKSLGQFDVRRLLPSAKARSVGPYVFFDHMGPAIFEPGQGIAVRPHPHIGLATLTYLYEGVIRHRDSLGYRQDIKPGAVNWMTAGRGIVHSERSPEETEDQQRRLMGLQVWVALPKSQEKAAPDFIHLSASSLPEIEYPGAIVRLVAGKAFGKVSKLTTHSPLFFVDMRLEPGAELPVDIDYPERALYVVQGSIQLAGQEYSEGEMLLLSPGKLTLVSASGAIVAGVGGEPLDGPRHMWWNFVASDQASIEQAKRDWQEGAFGHVPGDSEYIPLPE